MLELIWIIATLILVTLIASIAKKWGSSVLTGMVMICIVIANIFATKIIKMFGFVVPAGVIVYSVSFLITDMISEFYGKKTAIRTVFLGFLSNIFLVIMLLIVLKWPHAFGPEADGAFHTTLSFSVRITIASLITYLISQFHDVFAFDFWGKLTKGKYLWIRNNASTLVSQLLDTCIFISIAFWGGKMPIGKLIIGQFCVKVIIAILDTPFLYMMKKYVFDSTEYNVFNNKK